MNLGKFFDITEVPKKADVIVCLGGGGSERIKKALELYLSGYSKSEKIILTGGIQFRVNKKIYNKVTYLVKNGVPRKNIIIARGTTTTMKEVLVIKNYLFKHHLKSVMFVSDPAHSRRIIFLANTIANYNNYYGLSCFVVGSGVAWWNREHYYRNKKAVLSVTSEVLKLPTNYIAYGILEPLGLYDPIKEYTGSLLYSIKYHIQKILR